MGFRLGNSGAPRWYDNDRGRLREYVRHLRDCGADATEIVLHDGPADEFTGRVHVLRPDWESVIAAYRDAGISVYFHGSLTPEFATHNWATDPAGLLDRYASALELVGSVAEEQGGSTLVLHGSGDPTLDLSTNERVTAELLAAIAERLVRHSNKALVAIELRTGKGSRPTASATDRDSVVRIVEHSGGDPVGICWDVAHDFDNSILQDEPWKNPDQGFLDLVTHVHVHDIGDDGEPHCPPIIGRVPIADAFEVLDGQPAIMEVRWRMAERMGEPWEILARSYQTVRERLTAQP